MKKVNRMIAIMLSVLLLAAAFCMTACKDDKKKPQHSHDHHETESGQ